LKIECYIVTIKSNYNYYFDFDVCASFTYQKMLVQWNLDLRKLDLRKNLDLRKIVGTTDFLVHKLFDLRKKNFQKLKK
jgi:hypothetical protein